MVGSGYALNVGMIYMRPTEILEEEDSHEEKEKRSHCPINHEG